MKFPISEKYMLMALDIAKQGALCGEVPVGALVVHNDAVISSAHNTVMQDGIASNHAELTALIAAAAFLKKCDLSDCTLYTTLEPCSMCSGAIAHYKVGMVVFGAYDKDYGCMFSKIDLPKLIGKSTPCIGGMCEDACTELLNHFFICIRQGKKLHSSF